MNTDWKAFLEKENNVTNEEKPTLQGDVLSDLSHYGLIKVSGDDAETFLQNQFTNDIRNITDTSNQISAWCTPKGRIIADFRIFKRADSYFLVVAADLLEHVLKKLQMYIMMSKVTLEDASDTLVHFGISGDNAAEILKEILTDSPQNNQTTQYKSLSILCLSVTPPRFEIIGELDDAKTLWNHCKANATPTSSSAKQWDYLNIVAGIPHITQASSESWIPQMVNFIAIDGVDFKKGCYPGQEVVARLNYLGKTKRRMYRILIDTDLSPTIDDAIASETDKDAGKIINATINPDGQVEALAVLKIAETEKPLTMTENPKAKISLLDLPYAIEG